VSTQYQPGALLATAGTAGRNYRADPVACLYEAAHVEYGERPRCAHCGQDKAAHLPTPRSER
jgi:phage terminase large subunit-like protein